MIRDPLHNAEHREEICRVFGALVGEWGSEYLMVEAPKSWAKYGGPTIGKVPVEYCTDDVFIIRVDYGQASFQHSISLA